VAADYTLQKLLSQRKLTRSIGDVVGAQLREYVATLTPLFRQKTVFGEHIQSTAKEVAKGADQAFKDLQTLYEAVAPTRPYLLAKELKSPIVQLNATLELVPVEYAYEAKRGAESRTIAVTRPFTWVLCCAGCPPQRMKDLLAEPSRSNGELQQFLLHYLAMQVIIARQPGIANLFSTLHFPLETGRLPGFGELPITFVGSRITTSLPPDAVILESTELSGKNVFEELVNAADVAKLGDPFKEKLAAVLKG